MLDFFCSFRKDICYSTNASLEYAFRMLSVQENYLRQYLQK